MLVSFIPGKTSKLKPTPSIPTRPTPFQVRSRQLWGTGMIYFELFSDIMWIFEHVFYLIRNVLAFEIDLKIQNMK